MIEQKMKYAVWKAADISKALKEGRTPEPGPPGGDQDDSLFSPTTTSTNDLRSSASFSNGSADLDRSSSFVDKDLQPRATGRSPPASSPNVDKAISQPPTSTPSYHDYDSPSVDGHRQELYNQRSYPTEQLPRNYPPAPQNYPSNGSPPQNYYPQEPPSQSYSMHESSASVYPSHDTAPQNSSQDGSVPVYSYPNFQTYPNFNDSTIPTAPTHFPPHYQVDASPQRPSFSTSGYTQEVRPNSGISDGPRPVTAPSPPPPPPPAYTYDCNYLPSVEKITEAHKAARFAVGALAFDDVPVAVDFLRRSLELLTNPSAESH